MLSHRAATEADIAAILALAECCETADQLNRPLHAADLTLPAGGETAADDWHLWHEATGHLVALARLRLSQVEESTSEGRFWLYAHPDLRGQGIEDAMIA